nr:ribonuclease H-like domain-containing protein [Tanacetum cinerariifolium]
MVSALKLLVLKTREYDLWSMRMEQYLTFIDHAIWEVIINGDSVSSVASASTEGIPTGSDEFPLPEQLPTAYEDKFPLLIQSDATAERIALLLKIGDSHGQRHSYNIQRHVTVTQLFKESVL